MSRRTIVFALLLAAAVAFLVFVNAPFRPGSSLSEQEKLEMTTRTPADRARKCEEKIDRIQSWLPELMRKYTSDARRSRCWDDVD
jgi:hypothetical protein